MSTTALDIQPVSAAKESTPKPFPHLRNLSNSWNWDYQASDRDGLDSNLLIFFHGLGDTQLPFYKLGCSLNLPQTAVLSLRAPKRVPLLEEDAFQWFESFDQLGELIQDVNPVETLIMLLEVLKHLVGTCKWPTEAIHLFGFAQGGSIAAELALRWFADTKTHIGSVTSVDGPLLSFPTPTTLCSTPCLLWRRPDQCPKAAAAYRKGFKSFQENVLPGQGMPKQRSEWLPIMKFWSQNLRRLQPWELGKGSSETFEITAATKS